MKLRNISLLLLLALLPFCMQAQKLSNPLSKEFFKLYEKAPNDALDFLFASNKWMEVKKDAVDNLKLKLRQATSRMGAYIGYEQIGEVSIGSSVMIQAFIVKYERQPLRFTLKYYKPNDKWIILNFSYDEDLDDDLEELMIQHYLDKD